MMKFKKALSGTLALCMLAGICTAPISGQALEPDYRFGDANLDNSVDVADAVLVARYAASDATATITDLGKIQGDVNLDGNLDGKDLTMILEFIARKRSYLGRESGSEKSYSKYCLTDDFTAQQVKDKEPDADFLSSQYDLTAKLMKEVAFSEKEHDNILLSPLSIAAALAMTTNGTDGETRAELEKLLGGDLDIETLNQYYHNWMTNLPTSDKAKLNLANSLWNSEELKIRDEYLQTVKDYYPNLDVFKAPFTDSTMKDINNWISDHTDNMIPEMLKEMDPNAVTYLINALAFDAEWETAWKDTQQGTFSDYNNPEQNVQMMSGKESYYIYDTYAEGFVKKYDGGNYSFVGILPRESMSVTLSDYLGMMTGASIQELLDSRVKTDVDVKLPKFSFSYDTQLNEAMRKLGVQKVFDAAAADFSKLYEEENPATYISRVLHNTFIDVNELGTKAAAATVVEVSQKGGISKNLVFNRPFVFMILDERTKLPVFIGSVKSPEAGESEQTLPELEEKEVRYSFVDADTGKIIPMDENDGFTLNTDIRYFVPTEPDGWIKTGPITMLSANPTVVPNGTQCFDADYYAMWITSGAANDSPTCESVPDGYTIEGNSLTWTKHENGSYDVVVKLKKSDSAAEPDTRLPALNPDEVRLSVVDADTGKPIQFAKDQELCVKAAIGHKTNSGMVEGEIYTYLKTNPFTVMNYAKQFSADKFTLEVDSSSIPRGYVLPENGITENKNENGSYDVTIKLKADPGLEEGQVRFTVVNRDTGDKIALDKEHSLLIYTDYIEQPENPVIGLPVLTLDQNPITVDRYANCCDPANNLKPVVHLSKLSRDYMLTSDHLSMTKYSNGSYDVVIKLDKLVSVRNG